MNSYRILLGSESQIKRDIVAEAVRLSKLSAEIIPIKAESYVPEQPYGKIETAAGATNRALGVLRICNQMLKSGAIPPAPEDTVVLAVAIENGLFPEVVRTDSLLGDMVTKDRGCVTIIIPRLGRDSIQFISDGVVVPPELVIESMITHNQTITCGMLESKRTQGCDHTDPYRVWSKGRTNRMSLMIPTMCLAFDRIKTLI
jgi:hypothetical protein